MQYRRVLTLSAIDIVLLVGLVYLIPFEWIPSGLQQSYSDIFGEPVICCSAGKANQPCLRILQTFVLR